jgi:hypothetical protein
MSRGERLEEIRGSAVLAQLARSVATLWEVEPGLRMLDAVVNDVPPMNELWFQTSTIGDHGIRWELAGPPVDAEDRAIRERLLQLEPGTFNFSEVARLAFGITGKKKPSGTKRTTAKSYAGKMAADFPRRFRVIDGGLEVVKDDA